MNKCQNCSKHEGTERWIGEGSTMDFVHGNYSMWCMCCIIKYQLKYAKKIAKTIPKLTNKLKKFKCK